MIGPNDLLNPYPASHFKTPESSKFQHHIKRRSKCSILLVSSSILSPTIQFKFNITHFMCNCIIFTKVQYQLHAQHIFLLLVNPSTCFGLTYCLSSGREFGCATSGYWTFV